MMENRTRTFWCAAQQCFFGSIALALVTIVCFRLKADLPTTAFVYLAVIVLLSLIGSYFASVVLIIMEPLRDEFGKIVNGTASRAMHVVA
jgi:hypothetical protein